ncbi:MAG: hypothetical protein HYV33_05720 [Candidatus Kerfeldbacteria bacterium]|nr:hypothetical protein [Candidatus Kerfeldbacteria bacterium]
MALAFLLAAWPPIVLAENCLYPGTKGKVDSYYTGPLIDTHLHIPSPLDSDNGNPVLRKDMTMADIACTLRYEDTQSVFAFFPVYAGDNSYEQFYQAADSAKAKYPDLFVRFINPPGKQSGVPTVTVNRLKQFLHDRPNLWQGYGEIGLYANPDINFIVHGEQIENDVASLMDNYANIYFTVNDLYGDQYLLHQGETEASFIAKIDDYDTLLEQDLATWQERIETHPRQFMWGTDNQSLNLVVY